MIKDEEKERYFEREQKRNEVKLMTVMTDF